MGGGSARDFGTAGGDAGGGGLPCVSFVETVGVLRKGRQSFELKRQNGQRLCNRGPFPLREAIFRSPLPKTQSVLSDASGGLTEVLHNARHYPAIHWLTSYSEYREDLEKWYIEHLDKEFIERRDRVMLILQQENELMEIVKLVGMDVLPEDQKLILETARVIRTGFFAAERLSQG